MTYRKTPFFIFLLMPGLLCLIFFTYIPLVRALIDSLHDYRFVAAGSAFVGITNYSRLFADTNYIAAVQNNVIYIIFTVFPGLILALLLALALRKNCLVNRWLRAAFFFPTIIPLVAAASLWSFIFMPGVGLMDYYLSHFFSTQSHNFLGQEKTALLALIIISIWKFAGYYMLFFLAGLQSIPDDAMEAAQIEGASAIQCFWHITLPLLRPTLTFVGTVSLVYAVTQIDHVAIMTNGGPVNSTTVILHYIQTTAMQSYDYGKASAATFLTVISLFFLSWLNITVIDRGTYYER
jgi:sn-glycerol 3-phosphate transport system permease protein